MAQREVIHLTLGNLPQHISTLFFNQQSSHFRYDDTGSSSHQEDNLLLDPNVDFQEGIATRSGEQTFFPREIVVNFKSDLGRGWSAYNTVVDDEEDESDYDSNIKSEAIAEEASHTWSGAAELLHTSADGRNGRARRTYHDNDGELTDSDQDDDRETSTALTSENLSPDNEQEAVLGEATKFRKRHILTNPAFAYAHNHSHPRSTCALPLLFASGRLLPMNSTELLEGAMPFQSFELGMKLAEEMERNTSFSEDSMRWFAENSDSLQCFNMTTSTSDGFSGFSHGLTQMLADEYPKTPVIAWGAQSGSTDDDIDGREGKFARLRRMNNILSLWSLSSTSLYIPLKAPLFTSYSKETMRHFSSRIDFANQYQAAALFAAHIDTAMMRLRLKDPLQQCSAATMIDTLNWRRDTPIASLGGCMPTPLLAPMQTKKSPIDPIEALLASRGYGSREKSRNERHFETLQERAEKAAKELRNKFIQLSDDCTEETQDMRKSFAQIIIARDGDKLAREPTSKALEAWNKLQEPIGQSTFIPLSYNIQSASFPQIFRKLTSNGRPMPEDYNFRPRIQSVPMVSSLSTTPNTAATIRDAYDYLVKNVINGHQSLQLFGLGGGRGMSAGQAASEESEGPLGGRDGLLEIRERLEELMGSYDGDDETPSKYIDDELGTDEEYENEIDEWDLIE